jgi:hypothetical protein
MPITNTQQARIDLSRAQYKAIADIWRSTQQVSVSLEETNIPNTVALLSKNGEIKLIHHNGEVHILGKGR